MKKSLFGGFKTFLLIALCLCLVFSVSACNDKGNDDDNDGKRGLFDDGYSTDPALLSELDTFMNLSDAAIKTGFSFDITIKTDAETKKVGDSAGNKASDTLTGTYAFTCENDGQAIEDYNMFFTISNGGTVEDAGIWKGYSFEYSYPRYSGKPQVNATVAKLSDNIENIDTELANQFESLAIPLDFSEDDFSFRFKKTVADGKVSFFVKGDTWKRSVIEKLLGLDTLDIRITKTNFSITVQMVFDEQTSLLEKIVVHIPATVDFNVARQPGSVIGGYAPDTYVLRSTTTVEITALSFEGNEQTVPEYAKDVVESSLRNRYLSMYSSYTEKIHETCDTSIFSGYNALKDTEDGFLTFKELPVENTEKGVLVGLPARILSRQNNILALIDRVNEKTYLIDTDSGEISNGLDGNIFRILFDEGRIAYIKNDGSFEVRSLTTDEVLYSGTTAGNVAGNISGAALVGNKLITVRADGYYENVVHEYDLTAEQISAREVMHLDIGSAYHARVVYDSDAGELLFYTLSAYGVTTAFEFLMYAYDADDYSLIRTYDKPVTVNNYVAMWEDKSFEMLSGDWLPACSFTEGLLPRPADPLWQLISQEFKPAYFDSERYDLFWISRNGKKMYFLYDRETSEFVYSFIFTEATFVKISDSKYMGISNRDKYVVYIDLDALADCTPLPLLSDYSPEFTELDNGIKRLRFAQYIGLFGATDDFFITAHHGFLRAIDNDTLQTVYFENIPLEAQHISAGNEHFVIAYSNEIWIYNTTTWEKTVLICSRYKFVGIYGDDFYYYLDGYSQQETGLRIYNLKTGVTKLIKNSAFSPFSSGEWFIDTDERIIILRHGQQKRYYNLDTLDFIKETLGDVFVSERDTYGHLPYITTSTLFDAGDFAVIETIHNFERHVFLYDKNKAVVVVEIENVPAQKTTFFHSDHHLIWSNDVGVFKFLDLRDL